MRERSVRLGLLLVTAAAGLGCRGEAVSFAGSPPAPVPSPAPAATAAPTVAGVPAPSALSESASPAASAASESAAAQAAASSTVDSEPPLVAADGAPLPQTDERPSVTSERFKRRMQRLANAIQSGEVEQARSTFFPLLAYAQVKDVQKPERDYRYRLMARFERDVRDYRKLLGRNADRAEFLGVEVPEERSQWMPPGKEGNRLGYFRVLRSKLRFRLVGGAERVLELTSMISWRGEWYVVHLHGFE